MSILIRTSYYFPNLCIKEKKEEKKHEEKNADGLDERENDVDSLGQTECGDSSEPSLQ